ncbi:MAG: hypothetical protein NC305_11025 [Lachnospiraceae bacterium]|nr:hypothetical protein [Muribaculaceae bacterium]MCM1411065.1 hypothetical protein [Lachnospiraceae bacterium]
MMWDIILNLPRPETILAVVLLFIIAFLKLLVCYIDTKSELKALRKEHDKVCQMLYDQMALKSDSMDAYEKMIREACAQGVRIIGKRPSFLLKQEP